MKRAWPLVVLMALPLGAATPPPGFTDAIFLAGLNSPASMAFAPDGRLFI